MKCKSLLHINKQQTEIVVCQASSFFTRLRGLLFQKSMAKNTALLITPCSAIHCIGMLFSIDVIFLNKHFQIVQLNKCLRPFLIAFNFNARHVIEMPVGSIVALSLRTGDTIQLEHLK